jgi:Methyltransferase domain
MIGDTIAAVDIDRFAQELAALFDDFPRSEQPRGLRFDDVVDGCPNLAEENNLALVNLAARLLDPDETYAEAGTYYGASLIAAMRGNEGKDFVALDDFSFGAIEVKGRALREPGRAELEASLERFGATGATVIEGDALTLLREGALAGRRVGAFYYDASHAYEATVGALEATEPYLAPQALLIVDDYDWDEVSRATRDFVDGRAQASMLFEIRGERHGFPQWWEGVAVVAWRAR